MYKGWPLLVLLYISITASMRSFIFNLFSLSLGFKTWATLSYLMKDSKSQLKNKGLSLFKNRWDHLPYKSVSKYSGHNLSMGNSLADSNFEKSLQTQTGF